jgi:hypothetical protein
MKLILITLLLLAGCVQREYQHDFVDPNGHPQTRYYKENYFLTKSSAESVEVITPDGTIIKINKPVQDNDSLKASALIGVVPVVVETK